MIYQAISMGTFILPFVYATIITVPLFVCNDFFFSCKYKKQGKRIGNMLYFYVFKDTTNPYDTDVHMVKILSEDDRVVRKFLIKNGKDIKELAHFLGEMQKQYHKMYFVTQENRKNSSIAFRNILKGYFIFDSDKHAFINLKNMLLSLQEQKDGEEIKTMLPHTTDMRVIRTHFFELIEESPNFRDVDELVYSLELF